LHTWAPGWPNSRFLGQSGVNGARAYEPHFAVALPCCWGALILMGEWIQAFWLAGAR